MRVNICVLIMSVQVRKQLLRVASPLPSCGIWGLNLSGKNCTQVLLFPEPSHCSSLILQRFFDFIKINKIWGLSTFTSPIGPSSTQINLLGNIIFFQQMCWDHWVQRKNSEKPFAIEALGSSVWCPGKCERNEGRSGLCLCFCSPSKT